MSSVVGRGALLAVTMAAAAYTGDFMQRQTGNPHEDRFQSKTETRNRFRRPVNELINELGEGRGVLER
jgi:hypothetical protein